MIAWKATWTDTRNPPEPHKRPVPQMSEGYCSGDLPTPNLRQFVEENMTPYDPEHDDYQVEPFNETIDRLPAATFIIKTGYMRPDETDAVERRSLRITVYSHLFQCPCFIEWVGFIDAGGIMEMICSDAQIYS